MKSSELLMYVYVNGFLKKIIKGTKSVYIIDLKKGMVVDYFLNDGKQDFKELDVFLSGKHEFYISNDGKACARRCG